MSDRSGLTLDSLNRHDFSSIAEDMAQRQSATAAKQASLFKNMFDKQNQKMEQLTADLAASTLYNQLDYAEGADGVEEWITDAILAEDLKETHKWWDVKEGRYENQHETLLRSRVYAHLIAQLPSELYSQHDDGDVLNIYRNIISLGTKDSSEQVLSLERDIQNLHKEGRPMASWLNDLYVILSKLSTLDQPRTVAQVRNTIIENLQHDPRYTHVLRDMRRNPTWDMTTIRVKLTAEATAIDDLLPRQHSEPDSDSSSDADDHSSVRLTEKEKIDTLEVALKKKTDSTSMRPGVHRALSHAGSASGGEIETINAQPEPSSSSSQDPSQYRIWDRGK